MDAVHSDLRNLIRYLHELLEDGLCLCNLKAFANPFAERAMVVRLLSTPPGPLSCCESY